MIDISSIDALAAASAQRSKPDSTTHARVVREDPDGTVWVQLLGSEVETPCQATSETSPGDMVQVRIANGRAVVTGNATDRSASGARAAVTAAVADVAAETAESAGESAAEAQSAAESAAEAAETANENALQAADVAALIKESLKGYATKKYVDAIIYQVDPDDGGESYIVIEHDSGISFAKLGETGLVYWGNEWPNKIFEAHADGTGYLMGNRIVTEGMLAPWQSFAVTADTTNTVNIRSQACEYNAALGLVRIDVQLGITASAAIAAGARIPVFTIPAAYRPKQIEAIASSHVQTGTTTDLVNAWAHNGGPVYVRKSAAINAGATSDYIQISGMWHI